MTRAKKPDLTESVLELLPEATIICAKAKDWHSATFSGISLEISLSLAGDRAIDRLIALAENLPDHEFDLRRYIVADISLEDIQTEDDTLTCRVSALLLNE